MLRRKSGAAVSVAALQQNFYSYVGTTLFNLRLP
jgi:hypothetical protein